MSSLPALCASLSLVSLIASVSAQGTYSYTPAAAVPTGASLPLAPSFAGFGIEPSNLFSFTGNESPNELSINLLQNLANYTGTPPHLRIGGNTQDYMEYVSSITQYQVERNPNPTVSSAAFPPDIDLFGPTFFTALDRFPTNTPITYGLNLAYQGSDYASRIVAEASAAFNLSNVNLTSFEIGNEVDLYAQNGFRTGTWDGSVYTQEWLDRANIVYTEVLKAQNIAPNFFEPGCTASTIGTSFQIDLLTQDGISADANGSSTNYISQWNQHDYYYYIGVSTYTLTIDIFTDLSTTATQFGSWVQQIAQATSNGYRYALREMGVVGPIGMAGITDVFAASLWTMNFFLYAATLNITSVQMHMTDNSNASAWQPIAMYGSDPFIRPNYYAFAAMAQVIGCGGGIQVAGPGVISDGLPGGYANRFAIYPTYSSSKLASIVIINTVIANASDTSKNSVTVDLSLPDFANQKLYLSYLTADGADSQHNATWNGVSYEQNSVGIPVVMNGTVPTITVGSDGSASVAVRDSQAVVVNIGKVLGDYGANSSCSVNTSHKTTSTTTSSSATTSATATPSATASGANGSQNTAKSSSSQKGAASSFSRDVKIHHLVLVPFLAILFATIGF